MSLPWGKLKIILILLFALPFASCNTHYGYRAKVKVKNSEEKLMVKKVKPSEASSSLLLDTIHSSTDLLASAEVLSDPILVRNPALNFVEPIADSLVKVEEKPKIAIGSNRKYLVDKEPINYYAKWAFTFGLISLIAGILLAPVTFYLGKKALKEVKRNNEKGIGRAWFGLGIGLISLVINLFVFLIAFFEAPLIVLALLLLVLLLNRFIYQWIKKSPKNPENKNKPINPNQNRNNFWRIAAIVLFTLSIIFTVLAAIALSSGPGIGSI